MAAQEPFIPREHRFLIQDGRHLLVRIRRFNPEEELDAEIINLSYGGAKITVTKPMVFSELVELHLLCPEIDVAMPARICWTRPVDDDLWSVGVAFSERLRPGVMNELSSLGYLERRTHGRHEVDFEAQAKWELIHCKSNVRIRDFSTGGFVMLSDNPAQADQQLILEVPCKDTFHVLSARVVWQAQTDTGYRIGCSFVSPDDAEAMRRAASFHHQDLRLEHIPRRISTESIDNRIAVGVFLMATWVGGWFLQGFTNEQTPSEDSLHGESLAATADSESLSLEAPPTDSGIPPNLSESSRLPHEDASHANRRELSIPSWQPVAIKQPSDSDAPRWGTPDAASMSTQPATSGPLTSRPNTPSNRPPSAESRHPPGSDSPPASPQPPVPGKRTANSTDVPEMTTSGRFPGDMSLDVRTHAAIGLMNSQEGLETAMRELAEIIKSAPRDPAYRYVMASISRTVGHAQFSRRQIELGVTLEQRYEAIDATRFFILLDADRRAWVDSERRHRLSKTIR